MLFTRPPRTADDIRAFCARFSEGLRVEYKANLDDAVRGALPKVISSFANSHGGVIVLGVRAVNGVPQEPIEGFEPPAREEIPLTIENMCLQNLYPPLFPHITEVPGDVAERKFFVLEVDESADAPHAIENSTRVYVRTGSAANPYELAHVDAIIELLRRRENPTSTREKLLSNIRLQGISSAVPRMEVQICPVFPKAPLCTVEDCWEFLSTTNNPATRNLYFNFETLRRVEGGVAAFVAGNPLRGAECAEINCYGLVSGIRQLTMGTVQRGGDSLGYLLFGDVFQNWVKIYMCASAFYTSVGFKGNLLVQIVLKNMKTQSLPFMSFEDRSLDEFRCFDHQINASHILSAENLAGSIESVTHQLLAQLCWAVWQGSENFPSQILNIQSTAQLRRFRLIP
jgi:Putative DNA-binding domain